jgi:hypothetical protein
VRCEDCGADVELVLVIPETPRRGATRKQIPLDLDYDVARSDTPPSHALSLSRRTCRPITRDHPLLDHENPALTHFATCPARRPTEEVTR